METLLQRPHKRGTMVTVKDGTIVCPCCRCKTSQQIRPDTHAKNLQVWCRKCKHTAVVDIEHGQCFLSQC